MKPFDRYLQRQRIKHAMQYVPNEATLLDVGCGEGVLFDSLGSKLKKGVGIDPTLSETVTTNSYSLLCGYFPQIVLEEKFDTITMLAVIEHFPEDGLKTLNDNCAKVLKERGRLIITTPAPIVDVILVVLKFFRIIDGMSLEEHYGFKPKDTIKYLTKDFTLIKKRKFQMGLNHLFVFEKN